VCDQTTGGEEPTGIRYVMEGNMKALAISPTAQLPTRMRMRSETLMQ